MKTYFIGVYRHNKKAVLQAVENVDFLSCEIIEYYGERMVTKKHLRENKTALWKAIKDLPKFKNCNKLVIE